MSGRGSNTVRNRDPAPVQITAEQLLRDAKERQAAEIRTPVQRLQNSEEMAEWRFLKRRGFEDALRNQKQHLGNYIKYAKWEEQQGEYERARNIFERALDVDSTSPTIWLKYAAFEVRNKFINRARNVYDRAVEILPRVDQLWYKYTYLQEMIGDIVSTRTVFERWMRNFPNEQAWLTYIKFEMRCGKEENARKLYERMIEQIPEQISYIRYAKWEERQGNQINCRSIFERSLTELSAENIDEDLYIEFAKFEIRCHEIDRARVIFKYGIDNVQGNKDTLVSEYTEFEKQYGDKQRIEDIITDKRRENYQKLLEENPYNYDIWFDYIKLVEEEGKEETVISVYEQAIQHFPPSKEKRFWRRYIYFWIYYAIYLEVDADDIEKARDVYNRCIQAMPNKQFTFGKIWILYAKFEIRQNNLPKARKILGQAIGLCPKPSLFKFYINLELRLMNLDRCRILYQKYIEYDPAACATWIDFAEFEGNLAEQERCEAIYELAIQQESLDTPELVWKKYIDYEIGLENREKVEDLYDRLLQLVQHSKVYISFAQYESTFDMEKARSILEDGISFFKQTGENEMRYQLLLALKGLEEAIEDNEERISAVEKRQARKVKKARMNEMTGIMEDYIDYVFPDDEATSIQMKMLEAAKKWKMSMKQPVQPGQSGQSGQEENSAKRVKIDEKIDLDDVSD